MKTHTYTKNKYIMMKNNKDKDIISDFQFEDLNQGTSLPKTSTLAEEDSQEIASSSRSVTFGTKKKKKPIKTTSGKGLLFSLRLVDTTVSNSTFIYRVCQSLWIFYWNRLAQW